MDRGLRVKSLGFPSTLRMRSDNVCYKCNHRETYRSRYCTSCCSVAGCRYTRETRLASSSIAFPLSYSSMLEWNRELLEAIHVLCCCTIFFVTYNRRQEGKKAPVLSETAAVAWSTGERWHHGDDRCAEERGGASHTWLSPGSPRCFLCLTINY